MNDFNSVETLTNTHSNLNLSGKTKFRLNEINKIKDAEMQERQTMSKKLSKYIVAFDLLLNYYFFYKFYWSSCRISKASFALIFSLTTGITKKLLKVTRKKNKKRYKNVILAKSQLNSIKTLMSQALINLDISHEEFKTIINEKEKYKQMKENITSTKSGDELRENSRDIRKIVEMHRFFKKHVFLLCM